MTNIDWAKEFPGAVTICDTNGIILYMNKKSEEVNKDFGGKSLIGKSLFDCHQPRSCEIIRQIIATQQANNYTIEKKGKKKFINQSPWYQNGTIAGLVEISLEIPEQMPHFIRS